MTADWKQNEEDVVLILCDSVFLFRECHDILNECGQRSQAEKVKQFCSEIYRCMLSGEPWTKVNDI